MKKVVCWVLCMVLVSSVGVSLAETAEEKGMQAIWDMLNENFQEDGAGGLIEKDTFTVFLNDEGQIVINTDASVVMAVFGTGGSYAAEMVSTMYVMFASASKAYTKADVYFLLNYQGDTLYYVTPEWVLDVGNETVYGHIKHN